MRVFFAVVFIFVFVGCASSGSVELEKLNHSITDLSKVVIDVLPIRRRTQSANEREFFSEYYVIRNGEYEEAGASPIRTVAHISILGDRRPYTIQVQVILERRTSSGEYSFVKYDTAQARVLSRRIQSALHKRREDRNIIDDFRIF